MSNKGTLFKSKSLPDLSVRSGSICKCKDVEYTHEVHEVNKVKHNDNIIKIRLKKALKTGVIDLSYLDLVEGMWTWYIYINRIFLLPNHHNLLSLIGVNGSWF